MSCDIFLASDWLSGSARKETCRENSTGSILEILHASPHRSQPWRHFPASQPAWQPARLPASDPARKLASCAAGYRHLKCMTILTRFRRDVRSAFPTPRHFTDAPAAFRAVYFPFSKIIKYATGSRIFSILCFITWVHWLGTFPSRAAISVARHKNYKVREKIFSKFLSYLRRRGAPDLRKWSTTLEIKIQSSISGQERPYPAGSLLYRMNTKMQNIKKFIFTLSNLKIQYSQCTNDDDTNDISFALKGWESELEEN